MEMLTLFTIILITVGLLVNLKLAVKLIRDERYFGNLDGMTMTRKREKIEGKWKVICYLLLSEIEKVKIRIFNSEGQRLYADK
jgi:hypothetical protein